MDFAKSHVVAVSGHTGFGLDIFGHRNFNKSIDDTVEQTQTCISCLRDRQPSFSSIAVTLDLVLKSLLVERAALLWIFSIWIILFLEKGSHMGEAYSKWGSTKVL